MSNLLLRINFDKHFENPHEDDGRIIITSPTRKDNFIVGDTMTINWTFHPSLTGNNIRIRLREQIEPNQGNSIHEIIASYSINSGTYSFVIPAIGSFGEPCDGGRMWIQIRNLTTSETYETDCFSIGNYNKYYALETVSVDGYQWLNKIINEPIIDENVGEDKEYTSSGVTIVFDDTKINGIQEFRALMESEPERFLHGVEGELYDHLGVSIRLFSVQDWNYDLNVFTISLSDKVGNFLNTPVWEKYITVNEFPNANNDAYNQLIPWGVGQVETNTSPADGTDSIKCWYVNKSGTEKYLVGKAGISWALLSIQVLDQNDIDITASSTMSVGSDGYYYINHAGVFDYIKVYTTTFELGVTTLTSLEMLNSILDIFDFDYDTTALTTFFQDRGYDLYTTPLSQYIAEWKYFIDEGVTPKDILKEICTAFELDYYINKENKIVFTFLDYENLTPDKTFQQGEINGFSQDQIDTTKLINSVIFSNGYDIFSKNFTEIKVQKNYNSISDWGVETQIESTYKTFGLNPTPKRRGEVTSKFKLINNIEPQKPIAVTIDLGKVSDVNLLNKISFPYPSAITGLSRLYQVRGKSLDYVNNLAVLKLWDIDRSQNIDTAQKVLINANDFDGSAVLFDSAVDGAIVSEGTVTPLHSTTQKKYGLSSLRFPGTKYIILPYNLYGTRLDILDTTVTDRFALEGFYYFDGLGSIEYIYVQYVDANNYIELKKTAGNVIVFEVVIGGVAVINLTSTTVVSASTWYRLLVFRGKTGDLGLYVDGSQEDFLNNNTSYSLQVSSVYGADGLFANNLTGYADGFQINHKNRNGVVPNVDLTDSYVLQTRQQGFYIRSL
jgi:hypothetical protein